MLTTGLILLAALGYFSIGYGLAMALLSLWNAKDPKHWIARFLFPLRANFSSEVFGQWKGSETTFNVSGHYGKGEAYIGTTMFVWPFKLSWIVIFNAFLLAILFCYGVIVGPTRIVQRLRRPKTLPGRPPLHWDDGPG